MIRPEFIVNLNDHCSLFRCKCGKDFRVYHDSGIMDNNDAPNYCSNCGERLDWSSEDD